MTEASESFPAGTLASTLAALFRRRATGRLTVEAGGERHAIFFDKGIPVRVALASVLDPLGRVLLEMSAIDETAYHQSLVQMAESKKLQGQVLLEMGAIDEATLRKALTTQQRRKLGRLCRIKGAQLSFTEDDPGMNAFPINPVGVVLMAFRENPDEAELDRALVPCQGRNIGIAPGMTRRVPGVDAAERALLERLELGATFDECVAGERLPPLQARILLASLALTGNLALNVELKPRPAPRAPAAHRPRSAPRPRAASQPAAAGGDEPGPAADRLPPRAARKPPAADPSKAPTPQPSERAADARQIRRLLEEKVEALDAGDFFSLFGVTDTSPSTEIQRAFFQMAKLFHPDRFAGELEELRHTAQRVFAGLNQAKEILLDPERRMAHLQRLARKGDTATLGAEEKAGAARLLEAEADFAFKRGDWAAAAAKFDGAVKLEPTGKRMTRLAWAIWARDGKTRRVAAMERAIDLLDESLKLDENLAETYRYIGRLLKIDGRPGESIQWFRRASELDPHDLESASEVRVADRRAEKEAKKKGWL